MSKFGLPQEGEDDAQQKPPGSLSDKLASFPQTTRRHAVDLAAADAAAARHGFTSREPAPPADTPARRKRRISPAQPVRHLAIRCSFPLYDRFVAFADRHQVTYHEGLEKLLDYFERSEGVTRD